MKYYIVAGEASGDLHASILMKSLKQLDKEAEFAFWRRPHEVCRGIL